MMAACRLLSQCINVYSQNNIIHRIIYYIIIIIATHFIIMGHPLHYYGVISIDDLFRFIFAMSLFIDCVNVILRSIDLQKKASVNLPKHITYFILFEACTSKNYAAIEAVVKSWPHSELCFNFMSTSLCRRRKELSKWCIEAHEYYNNYSTDQYADCISSIALGVFNNLYACLHGHSNSFLEVVDLNRIRVAEFSNGKPRYC